MNIMTIKLIGPSFLFFCVMFYIAEKYITNEVILSWIQ